MRLTLNTIIAATGWPAVLLAGGLTLSSCGDSDPEEERGPDVESTEAAITIPNLQVSANQCYWRSTDGEIWCMCSTRWLADNTHAVYSSCRVQKWDGSKFVTVSPIKAMHDRPSAYTWMHAPCVPGTYRAWAGGRVLFSGGWSELVGVGTPHDLYFTINRCP